MDAIRLSKNHRRPPIRPSRLRTVRNGAKGHAPQAEVEKKIVLDPTIFQGCVTS